MISDEHPWGKPLQEPCHHPEHEIPTHLMLQPGIYEHECPGCGLKLTYEMPGVYSAQ